MEKDRGAQMIRVTETQRERKAIRTMREKGIR